MDDAQFGGKLFFGHDFVLAAIAADFEGGELMLGCGFETLLEIVWVFAFVFEVLEQVDRFSLLIGQHINPLIRCVQGLLQGITLVLDALEVRPHHQLIVFRIPRCGESEPISVAIPPNTG
nr:hypothetical protein [uncultured Pseudomonas sp.]